MGMISLKTSEIAKTFKLDRVKLDSFIVTGKKYTYQESFLGSVSVQDSDVDSIISDFYAKLEADVIAEQERVENANKEATQQLIEDKARAEQQLFEEKAYAEAALNKKKALTSMLITSGFSFDGYSIKKYSGYISGDAAVQVERGTAGIFARATNVGDSLMGSLSEIRREALAELKEAAFALGCNAVIGVDFDYITLDPQTATSQGGTMYLPYVFGVTANGNAVIIEKTSEF